MAVKVPKACKKCYTITDEETCPRCGSPTSKEWQGYVVVVDHVRSEIARKMGLNANGKYALRVR